MGTPLWTRCWPLRPYCSYLYPASQGYDVTASSIFELAIRVLFFFLAAMVVNRFAIENRRQTLRYQAVAGAARGDKSSPRNCPGRSAPPERLAALGQLSAGLAHEIRNPLGIIKGSAEMLTEKLKSADPLSGELAGYISTEVNRLSALVSRFLDFARPLQLELRPHSLPEVVDRALKAVAANWSGPEVKVERHYESNLPAILLDEDFCEQVFVNLAQNAYEAMSESGGGLLRVSIALAVRRERRGIEVRVADSGPGISREFREQIFNPFVTTKKTGVGLGLSIVSKIVDEHRGSIELADRAGGAAFIVFFPFAEEAAAPVSHAGHDGLTTMLAILIVEDEARMRRLLELDLGEAGFQTFSAPDAEAGLALLCREHIDQVLTDLKLPGMSGLEFLQSAKRINAALPVIVMTAYGTVETAVEAMKAGASDYVLKPFSLAEMRMVVQKELDVRQLREENRSLREALGHRYTFPNVVASSTRMQEVLALVERVASTPSTVLLGGESGVGKDLIARVIHQRSNRASGPFIKINSTAIPENLLESELFGYEKGAFTGAATSKPGKFELADKGTMFLDEIGDVPPATQVKLLRVLQEREFERLGGTRTIKIDVRLIAATNRDLRAALEQGTFREDLYYRLNVVPIDIPPLREHKEDIPELVNLFLARFAKQSSKAPFGIAPEALKKLMEFHWPGNVRELENILERACALAPGPVIESSDIHLDRSSAKAQTSSAALLPDGKTLDQWEDEIIREAYRRAGGNKSQAARTLGLSRNALRYRLEKVGIPDDSGSEKSGSDKEDPTG